MKLPDQEDILLSWWGYFRPQDRSMPTTKDTKDSCWERKGKGCIWNAAPRNYYHFQWQRCDWLFSVWREHKWRILFTACMSGTSFSLFSARGIIRKESCFCKMENHSQNCKMSHKAMDKVHYRLFMIPLQSPDLNHRENIFHFVDMCLRKDAIMKKIKRETYEQFCNHVTNTFHNFPSDIIDRTIALIANLIDAAIKMEG